ncbi:uncharacterized protein [Ptychodera flava]|uniref:uncharacterized protein n=1 Tax=Ptychodera flava TaxID=63121 RepID=UPI00396AA5B9
MVTKTPILSDVSHARMFRVAVWLATLVVSVYAPATGRSSSHGVTYGGIFDTSYTAAKVRATAAMAGSSIAIVTENFQRNPKMSHWPNRGVLQTVTPTDYLFSGDATTSIQSGELQSRTIPLPEWSTIHATNVETTSRIAGNPARQTDTLRPFLYSSPVVGEFSYAGNDVIKGKISPSLSLTFSTPATVRSLGAQGDTIDSTLRLTTPVHPAAEHQFTQWDALHSNHKHPPPCSKLCRSTKISSSYETLAPSEQTTRTHTNTVRVSQTPGLSLPALRSAVVIRKSKAVENVSKGAIHRREAADDRNLQVSASTEIFIGPHTTQIGIDKTTEADSVSTNQSSKSLIDIESTNIARINTIATAIATPTLHLPLHSNIRGYSMKANAPNDTKSLGFAFDLMTRSSVTHIEQSERSPLHPTASNDYWMMTSIEVEPERAGSGGNRRHGLSGYPRSKLTTESEPDSINILMPILVFVSLVAVIGKLIHRCCTHSRTVRLRQGAGSDPNTAPSSRRGQDTIPTISERTESTRDIMKEMRYIYRRQKFQRHCHCCCDHLHSSQNPLLRTQSRDRPLALYLGENINDEGADVEAQVTRL